MLPAREFQYAGTLQAAVHHARDIHKQLKSLWQGDGQGIDVENVYWDHVHELAKVGKQCRVSITLISVPANTSETHGVLVRKRIGPPGTPEEEENTILIPPATRDNLCWKRFTICKELCHLRTEENSKLWCYDVMVQLQSAANRPVFTGDDPGSEPLSSEQYCYFMALELAVPWFVRKADASFMKTSPQQYLECAQRFKVPEAVIEAAFNTGYFAASALVNRDLDIDSLGLL